ncbi:growth-regulating factor 10-like [Ananas comosus]|uniref:Growth-regulating factor n=1 Tax=Ananas comosus TaxID=4615 RepID=A0A6P5FUB9_ANACO|nr:growth-regulating factor 10-like [Ananas comosus]
MAAAEEEGEKPEKNEEDPSPSSSVPVQGLGPDEEVGIEETEEEEEEGEEGNKRKRRNRRRRNRRRASFTVGQLQEMERQALIYKYMATGVAVPIHLILPIWKSVASSPVGPHRYPSLIGLGNLCLDFWNNTEPEPGRCRRTDGKKWRCSRDVIPDQKYCERHMHRGRIKKPHITAAAADQTPPENTIVADSNHQASISDPAAANVDSGGGGGGGASSSSSSDASR